MAEEEKKIRSLQPRFNTTKDVAPAAFWTFWEQSEEKIPKWGSYKRIAYTRNIARNEPIMAGAVGSMISRIVALDWEIKGGRNLVRRFHDVLSKANDGDGWDTFIDPFVFDYTTTDIGGLGELGRENDNDESPVVAIWNLDAGLCQLTGNRNFPILYTPQIGGKSIKLKPWDFMRSVDQIASEERMFGMGYCAVSRALKAINVLLKLYNYEDEMLSDMPPQGIASITGMTDQEVETAFLKYDAMRQSKQQMTFKGVLWLVSTMSPLQQVKAEFTPFANLPDGFNKQEAISIYVATLALCFGVDVREFWPFSNGPLGSAAEAEVQAEKAKGKGLGRMLSAIQRAINWNVLPEGLEFEFDMPNSEEEMTRAQIAGAQITNVRKLWEPAMSGEGLITTEEARRWLVELKAVPDWLIATPETSAQGENKTVEPNAQTPEANGASTNGAASTPQVPQPKPNQAVKEQLAPGEDIVAMNRRGDIRTIWTSRFYSIPRPQPRLDVGQWAGEWGADTWRETLLR